jgi:hypothetical protein
LSITILAIIIVGGFYLFLYGLQSHWFDPQESNTTLIRYMEYYANEKLPSCKVLEKEKKERYHNIAVYCVDSIDFMKIFNNFREITPEFELDNGELKGETQYLISKSLPKDKRKHWSKNIVVYKDESIKSKKRKLCFIYPNIIILEDLYLYEI